MSKNVIFIIISIITLYLNNIISTQPNSTIFDQDLNTSKEKGRLSANESFGYESNQKAVEPKNYHDLINAQGDINKQDFSGKTLLHHAFEERNYELIRFLLFNNAKSNLKDKENRTVLHLFAKYPFKANNDLNLGSLINKYILDYLLKNGANVNDQDSFGLTPLHIAIISKNQNIALLLLENNADANIQDNYGNTPLHDAFLFSSNNDPESNLIKNLKEKTNLNLKNKYGLKPLEKSIKQSLISSMETQTGNFLKRRKAITKPAYNIFNINKN